MKKILTLLALGFAAKYFLDSKEGQEFKSRAKGWIADAEKKFSGAVGKTETQADQAEVKMG